MRDADISKGLAEGQQAQAITEALQPLFETIQQEIYQVWLASKTPEQREEAWLRNRGLQLLQLKLNEMLNNGKVAKAELEKLQKQQPQS